MVQDSQEIISSINLLAQEMEHNPDDLHEVHFKLAELLNQLKASGMPLPDDLVRLEKQLDQRSETLPGKRTVT